MVGMVNKSGRGFQIFAHALHADHQLPPVLNPGYATGNDSTISPTTNLCIVEELVEDAIFSM